MDLIGLDASDRGNESGESCVSMNDCGSDGNCGAEKECEDAQE